MFVAQQNQDLYTRYMFVMMLLESRVGRSKFRNHYKVQCGTLLYTTSVNYWGQCPHGLIFYKPEKRGVLACRPRKILKEHALYLNYNCNQRPFQRHQGNRIEIKKHEYGDVVKHASHT